MAQTLLAFPPYLAVASATAVSGGVVRTVAVVPTVGSYSTTTRMCTMTTTVRVHCLVFVASKTEQEIFYLTYH